MNRSVGFAALAALTVFAASPASARLLLNGQFSDWLTPTQPANWTVEDTAYARVGRSADTTRSAPYAARITRTVDSIGNNRGLSQFAPVDPDIRYTLRAWFLDAHPDVKGGLSITWRTADSTYISNSGVSYVDTLVTDWQQVSRTATSPATAAYAEVLLRIYNMNAQSPAGGWLYVDDAVLDTGASAVAEPGPGRTGRWSLSLLPTLSAGSIVAEARTAGEAADARLLAYDLTGSLRAVIWSGRLGPGRRTLTWDGTGGDGRRVAGGLYFIVLTGSNGERIVRKAILQDR